MIGGGRQTTAPQNKDFLNIHLSGSVTSPYRTGSRINTPVNRTDTQTKGSNQRGNLEIQIPSDHISAGGPAKSLARSPVGEQSDIRDPSTNILEARLPPDGHEHPETYINGDILSQRRLQTSPGSYRQSQQLGGAKNTVDASEPPNDPNIQIPSLHKYELNKPGMSTFYPAVTLVSVNKGDMDDTQDSTIAPDLPSEAPPSLPAGPPPPIPDESTNEVDLQNTQISARTVNVNLNRDNTQNGATAIDLEFTAYGSGFDEKNVPQMSLLQTNADNRHIRSYVEEIVTTAVTIAKQNSLTNSTVDKPAMPTLLTTKHDSPLSQYAIRSSETETTESNRDKMVMSPVMDQSDLSSSASSLPTVKSLLLTSPRSYSGSRSGSRRSSIGSDAGSIASDISSFMRGAAPPLKPARRESVIETLEKKRRESIGPKLKGLQVPSRRASTGAQSGPMKALPTLAGLPAIGEKKGFGIKPFRSVQPFSRKIDSTTDSKTERNSAEVTLRATTLKIQDPKQRWSYHGPDSVFESPSVETTTTFGNQPPLASKVNQRDEQFEIKPIEAKPVAAPRSFKTSEQRGTGSRPSFHISVNTPENAQLKSDNERPMSPKSPPRTAPKPTMRKPITVEIPSSRNIDVKEHRALSPKSPPPTAPKPKPRDTQHNLAIDYETNASKPSLPPKPQITSKPKTSSSSESSLKYPLLSPTSPRSVVEEEIQPVTSQRIKPPVPELPSSPSGITGTNTEDNRPVMTEEDPVKSPADISDLLQQDLLISSNRINQTTSPRSLYTPVNEPEIHAIISSRTIKTETTVTFFPSSPKPFLQQTLPSESQVMKPEERRTISPSPVKVSETREIIKLETDPSTHSEPDIVKNTEANPSLGYISPSPLGNVSSPTSPPTQGPIPYHRIRVPSDAQEKDDTSHVAPPSADERHHTFSLTLNVTPMRQGPKPFGATSPTGDISITGAEWVTAKKDCDGDKDIGGGEEDELAQSQVETASPLLISIDDGNLQDVPPLPGTPPPSLPDCAPPPIPSGSHLMDDDVGQLSPAESGIKMDGSASDSATLESQSIDSLEDGLDYISSVQSSSNHSKTESEISIVPSVDLSKPDSPASSTATLIQLNGDEPRKAGLKGFDAEDTSEGRTSILSSPAGQVLSPSPTPSDADSGIGSNRSDIHKSDKGKCLCQYTWKLVIRSLTTSIRFTDIFLHQQISVSILLYLVNFYIFRF